MRNIIVAACLSLSCSAIAETWTVDDDGPADFDNIQAAIEAASNGDVISVEPGTYTGTGDYVINTLGKSLTLKSVQGAEFTTIDGQHERLVIRCGNGEDASTLIDGFTVTGGYGNQGGGMSLGDQSMGGSSPRVHNCIFRLNHADTSGGGIYNSNSSHPEILNCTFDQNTAVYAGAGMCNRSGSSPTVDNCTFTHNTCTLFSSFGGGMHCTDGSSPTITGCVFAFNSAERGGGISIKYNGNETARARGLAIQDRQTSPLIKQCTISSNIAWIGGGIYSSGSSPTIEDCVIESNTTTDAGAGIGHYANWEAASDATIHITRCTIANNRSDDGGGGGIRVGGEGAAALITDTDVRGNYADFGGGIEASASASVQINSSRIISNRKNQLAGYSNAGGGVSINDEATVVANDSDICSNVPWRIKEANDGTWSATGSTCVSEYCNDQDLDGVLDSCACTGDCDGDSTVGIDDLALLVDYWGTDNMSADVNNDGSVEMTDLLLILSSWGPCP